MKIVRLTVLAAFAAALVPAGAEAQYASTKPAPLYPYAVQPGQPYAIEVAPGTYVIKRPAERQGYPYVRCVTSCDGVAPSAARTPHGGRHLTHNDPTLIEELRRRHAGKIKHEVVNTTKIVRDKPVVIEHERVVDDPPRVIERRHYVDDAPARPRTRAARIDADLKSPAEKKGSRRVIRAEAEVTILGPDRMSIRLFRKGKSGADAKAEAE